jgi:hypothetical protein
MLDIQYPRDWNERTVRGLKLLLMGLHPAPKIRMHTVPSRFSRCPLIIIISFTSFFCHAAAFFCRVGWEDDTEEGGVDIAGHSSPAKHHSITPDDNEDDDEEDGDGGHPLGSLDGGLDDDDDNEVFGWNMKGGVFEELPGFLDSRPPQPEEEISAPAGFGRAEPGRSSFKIARDLAQHDDRQESSPDFTDYVAPEPHDYSQGSSTVPSARSSQFFALRDTNVNDNGLEDDHGQDDEYDDTADDPLDSHGSTAFLSTTPIGDDRLHLDNEGQADRRRVDDGDFQTSALHGIEPSWNGHDSRGRDEDSMMPDGENDADAENDFISSLVVPPPDPGLTPSGRPAHLPCGSPAFEIVSRARHPCAHPLLFLCILFFATSNSRLQYWRRK